MGNKNVKNSDLNSITESYINWLRTLNGLGHISETRLEQFGNALQDLIGEAKSEVQKMPSCKYHVLRDDPDFGQMECVNCKQVFERV